MKIKSLAFKDGKLIVQWTKGSHITGYQIEYSLKKDFSDSTIKTVSKAGTTKVILKNLTAGKTYFVRIRTYQKKNGEKYYSTWSKVSTCKGGIR